MRLPYNKYKNIKTVVDNITFDSKKEADRYCDLKLLLKKGIISDLKLQRRFDFHINDVNLGFYKADFVYRDCQKGRGVVEDTKGFQTPIYNLKKKLMKALHGIDILET